MHPSRACALSILLLCAFAAAAAARPPGDPEPEPLPERPSKLQLPPQPIPEPGAKLPPGADLPEHRREQLAGMPRIESFRQHADDCPRDGYPRNFLSYEVSNGITRVAIRAIYADGRSRTFYQQSNREPLPSMAADRISDPGMSPGQVAYVLEATGARGQRVSARVDFRTPDPPTFEFASALREIIDWRRDDEVRNHYEGDVRVSNAARIERISMQGRKRDGTPVTALAGSLEGSRLVSRGTIWTGARANRDRQEIAEFRVLVRGRDACLGVVSIEESARVELAP